jgi:hypothetical protein
MLITSNIPVFKAGFSRMINNAATAPMTRNKTPFNFIQPALVSSLIILSVVSLFVGCASTPAKLGSHRLAAVVIKGSSPDDISASAKEVFEAHQFDLEPEDNNELVFQKKASNMNSMLYGDWFSGPVWARAKLYLRELRPGELLLDCDVYMVQDPDDPLFQKERRVRASKSEFQKLLEEIKLSAEGHKTNPVR